MCHVDTSMLTAEWVAPSDEAEHLQLWTMAESMCANWEAVDSWARSRSLERGKASIRAGPFENVSKKISA